MGEEVSEATQLTASEDQRPAGDQGVEERRAEDPLLAEGDVAADYLYELLEIADLDGDVENYVESGRAHVSIETDDEVLVGKDGAVLEALQELARLAVVSETGHRSRLMLDVAGHRAKLREQLRGVAKEAVAQVRETGEVVRLTSMTAFERKVVHDVVAAAGLVSESEGEEPHRLVVVKPAG